MTTSFRKPFTVYERNRGYWSEGQYFPDDNQGVSKKIMATIQEPSTGDMNKIEAYPWGRRASRFIKIYTDEKLRPVSQIVNKGEHSYPGDLILFDGRLYLLFGESNFTMLSRSRNTVVSHWRYWACEMIEGHSMELAP